MSLGGRSGELVIPVESLSPRHWPPSVPIPDPAWRKRDREEKREGGRMERRNYETMLMVVEDINEGEDLC